MTSPWCIAWKDGEGKEQWCATRRNVKPTSDAVRDKTACDKWVMFRIGSERKAPTCPDCRAVVRNRGKR